MKRLIAFGDSWTHGHGVEEDIQYKEIASPDAFIFNLRMNNSWVRWLANKFDVPFVNLGLCGITNYNIVNNIARFKKFLDKNDCVIVMWSFPYRHLNSEESKNIDLQTLLLTAEKLLADHETYFFNSFYPTFKEEPYIVDFVKLSSWICPNITPADILAEYEKANDVSVWEYGSRKVYHDQRNFSLGDYHPNLLGYKVIANWMYDEILKMKQRYEN